MIASHSPGKYSTPLFDLPSDVPPGGGIELAVDFRAPMQLDPKKESAITSILSLRLWWGFATLDGYEVRLQGPDGYAIGTSSRYDAALGAYRAENIGAFGLFLGKGYDGAETDAGDVRVRAVFSPAGPAPSCSSKQPLM